jgi:hypothetical protein
MASLFENRFCTGVPWKFQILTNMPLVYQNLPGKNGESAIGPSPWPVAVMAKIRRGGGRGRWGEVGKMFRNSPATDLWLGWWRKGCPAGQIAAQPGGGAACARRGGFQRRRRRAGRGRLDAQGSGRPTLL